MAVYKPSRIYKIMREKNLPCYVINDGKVDFGNYNEKVSVETAVEMLSEALSEMSGNDVSVTISEGISANGKLSSRGRIVFERVDLSEQTVKQSVSSMAGFNNSAMMQTLIEKNILLEKQLIEAAAQKKIDELNARLERLESGDNNGINGVLNNLMQNEAIQNMVAGWLINSVGPTQSHALAGVSTDVEHCIERIKKVDPDFESNLQRLAQLAETNPQLYFTAIKFLG